MRTINISASRHYEVNIGRGLIAQIPELIKRIVSGKIAIITDSVVNKIYADEVVASLENAGYETYKYVIESGEKSKSIESYSSILQFIAKNGFVRSDAILALGGGVVGDLAGFVAGTYMRGISYIQVPTTLLSAIDSSVGGKTAINLPEGKNLAGVFYQPHMVICDIDTLDTLSEDLFKDGLAEGIKYGVLEGGRLWELIEKDVKEDIGQFIELCVSAKKRYVEQDEMDTGLRMHLNLGHSIGHALEKLSNYTILHGFAVAKGIALIARASLLRGMLSATNYDKILAVLNKYGFDINCGSHQKDIIHTMKMDKKVNNGAISLVMIRSIGEVVSERIILKNLEEYLSVCGN